ncbi:MAG: DNA ligase LigA-related protein, partial [Candidatus Kapaibacteriota bacterium]
MPNQHDLFQASMPSVETSSTAVEPHPLSPRDHAEQLRAQIRRADTAYYVEASPILTDRDYDRIFEELSDLEQQHP